MSPENEKVMQNLAWAYSCGACGAVGALASVLGVFWFSASGGVGAGCSH